MEIGGGLPRDHAKLWSSRPALGAARHGADSRPCLSQIKLELVLRSGRVRQMSLPSRTDNGPGNLEGLNPDDPGVRLLAEVARTIEPDALLLAHCGDLPGLRRGATRLILDVRERTGS